MKEKPVIAIDGPAGAGKSTLAKSLAQSLNLKYIDSGAMYRAFGLKCFQSKIDPENLKAIAAMLEATKIEFSTSKKDFVIYLDGEDVSRKIRTPEAGKAASIYSAIPIVRKKMISLQRKIGSEGGIVMDGRDIGTVVFPNADIKIFLDAGNITRAVRRFKELYGEEKEPDRNSEEFKKILVDQSGRDKADMQRISSPLRPADDAIILDSTIMSKNEVLSKALEIVGEKRKLKNQG